jgi:hypothetical protein
MSMGNWSVGECPIADESNTEALVAAEIRLARALEMGVDRRMRLECAGSSCFAAVAAAGGGEEPLLPRLLVQTLAQKREMAAG